jgi:hypothetical protein
MNTLNISTLFIHWWSCNCYIGEFLIHNLQCKVWFNNSSTWMFLHLPFVQDKACKMYLSPYVRWQISLNLIHPLKWTPIISSMYMFLPQCHTWHNFLDMWRKFKIFPPRGQLWPSQVPSLKHFQSSKCISCSPNILQTIYQPL